MFKKFELLNSKCPICVILKLCGGKDTIIDIIASLGNAKLYQTLIFNLLSKKSCPSLYGCNFLQ